ncbi:MAG: penicillin acylase family protein, partial [Acidobacteriota bacterium]|nr:penicillin acylase family protein [Acidobacteriota bacterium]
MRRVLLAVNVLIAIAVIAAGVAFYWIFYRAVPDTSGEIETRVLRPVQVDFDRLGVPHIHAQTIEDALFADGYAAAGDRLWQMDSLRRLASGQLAEIVGAAALPSDRESRRLRLRRIAESIYVNLTPEDKKNFAAYARGVNAFIESHRGRYGFEFALLSYDPRPWSEVDSILVGLQMFRTLASDWKNKLLKEGMLRGGEADKVNYLFPVRAGTEVLPGGDAHPGSNAWAISGTHTASGKPLLASDMHLEYTVPGIWHMVQIQAPGLNAMGVELPGLPGVIVGHNERIAWGVTNLGFDVQDLYNERIDIRTGQYLFEGHIEQARQERELILVRDRAPEEMLTWVTRHGPVFDTEHGAIYSLKWAAADPSIFHNVFLDVDRARDWDEFKAAISQFGGPGQNFVYADAGGNIGYHAAGKLPIRRNYMGDVPADGSSGQFEWDGYIPFDELPQAWNPPSGYIVSANQNPFPPDYPYHVTGTFAAPDRSRQILDMLKTGSKLQPSDNLRIQKDVYSGFNKFLAKQIVAAYDKRASGNSLFAAAVDPLRNWDGQMDLNLPQPLVTTLVYQYLRKAVAERASPGSGSAYDYQLSSPIVERLLKERPKDWFANYDELILRCLADGVEEGQRLQGQDPKRWRWGRSNFIELNHPVGSRIPAIGPYFNVGAMPMSGSPT